MKKTLTIIFVAAFLFCFSQTKQELISLAEDQAQTNYFKDADSTFAKLHRQFPGDSLVIRKHADTYWKYGRAKGNLKLLDESIKQYGSLAQKYPNNAEISLYVATAIVKRCDVVYFDLKSKESDKKALLQAYQSARIDLDKYSGQLDQSRYKIVFIAKEDLKSVDSRIKDLEKR